MYEYLEGGRNDIYKLDQCVYRPAEIWTEYGHHFLKYLHSNGFDKVPYPMGIDQEGIERLTFVEGIVYYGMLPEEVKSDEALISFCTLMKQFHDIGEKYVETLTGQEVWMLPARMPIETMCHGDFAPYNTVMDTTYVC